MAGYNMKEMMFMCLLSVIASAQVEVAKSAKDNPVTGVKVVTVLMTVKGDKPYSDDPSAQSAELGIMCKQSSLGNRQKSDVWLTLSTGVVAKNGVRVQDPGLFQRLGVIVTQFRFDEDKHPRQLQWQQTADYPDLLIREDFKFIRDNVFKSKLLHIEVTGSGTGTNVSSFDLSGLKEEYSKHPECKP